MNQKLIRPQVLDTLGYQLKKYPVKIKLNQNELPNDLEPKLKRKLLRKLAKVPFNRYPEFMPFGLMEQLAKKWRVKSNQIIVTNGSNILVQAVLLAASVGNTVLTLNPTFSVYELEAKLLGNKVVKFDLDPENFSLKLDALFQTMAKEKPAVVFICNPNAPTGNAFNVDAIKQILNVADNSLVVVDEAYGEFLGWSAIPLIKQYPHLVVLRTFSKAYGLGGVRLGYLVASEFIASNIAKVVLPYCVSNIAECIGEFILQQEPLIKKRVKFLTAERERIYKSLKKINQLKVFPSHTNFILFQSSDATKLFAFLLKKGVLIRDVSNSSLVGALRVSVGSKKENDTFLKCVKKFFRVGPMQSRG